MRTQVAIIGSGPAGLLLGQILHKHGIDSVILEAKSRDYVLSRIRAGVLEMSTVATLDDIGVSARAHREGLVHEGVNIAFNGARHRVDFAKLVGGSVLAYGQTEVTYDLMEARAADGGVTVFEAEQVEPHDFDTASPWVSYVKDGVEQRIDCDFIAGCDGYHGVSRASVPAEALTTYERAYPIGWLGLLADVPPAAEELVYSRHEQGFALCSMRSKTRSRYYIQCSADEDVEDWPDDRYWDRLRQLLDPETAEAVVTGPSIEKSVAALRSFVAEPLRFGNLALAGDAAHVVPPTGAKGLNLAASDVRYLADGLIERFVDHSDAALDAYSGRALKRIWNAERFSWWMTSLLHDFHDGDVFARKLQIADLEHIFESEAAARALAESYVGANL